ncbi:unnamed protein product (macronuclear) [Paramecium tetraurelia]|uniref:Uncharacterized protein n=1 Tax=Paramecium tetraurelia TaxID=5888 RepID=A0DJ37_PARTE|nr:uncharacterized protein GSPATT00017411001 [Paramecium tetraurelia]CAK83054.1 unnamed protein product [Paramecium tetraurelia]|eukprot:XP_001450451.1 hypothetical protein (macronuclear) [Paramecium tetraurelia strain d4-2]
MDQDLCLHKENIQQKTDQFQLAVNLFNQKKWFEADELFSDLVQKKQNTPYAQFYKCILIANVQQGQTLIYLNQVEKLIAFVEQIEKENPQFFAQVIEHCNQELKNDSENIIILCIKGIALDILHQFDESESIINEAIKLNPQFPLIQVWRCLTLISKKKYNEVIDVGQKALKEHPNFVILHHYVGISLQILSRSVEALEHFEIILQLNPNLVHIYLWKCISLETQNQYLKALCCYDLALKLDPNNSEITNQKSKKNINYVQRNFTIRLKYVEESNLNLTSSNLIGIG